MSLPGKARRVDSRRLQCSASAQALEPRRMLSVVLPGDVNAVPLSSTAFGNLTGVNGTLLFTADDQTRGVELWKSDGTSGGTTILKDIRPGGTGSNPGNFAVVNNTLYFAANDGNHGVELWKSDGTAAGTQMVADLNTGSGNSGNSSPFGLTNVNGTLYFFANRSGISGDNELWKSDGTAGGTTLVKSVGGSVGNAINFNGQLVFSAIPNTQNIQLWSSDGTAGGTNSFASWSTGLISASVSSMTNVGGTLMFAAVDSAGGLELWKSDGTAGGTQLVKDIRAGTTGSSLTSFTAIGSTLFFVANNGTNGLELWSSDGTTANTAMVKDIAGGSIDSTPTSLAVLNGKLYFAANDFTGTTGNELWTSDGTSGGTVVAKDLFAGGIGGNPSNMTAINGTLYFSARGSATTGGLWKSDGTVGNATLVRAFGAGWNANKPAQLTAIGNTLFFAANDGISGNELWTSDLVGGTTQLAKDIYQGTNPSQPRVVGTIGNVVVFFAGDGTSGIDLWRSDGTGPGTYKLFDSGGDMIDMFDNPRGCTVGSTLFFAARSSANGQELWKTDGNTTAGTGMVKDIVTGTGSSQPRSFQAVGNLLVFSRENAGGLWRSDGTSAGTVQYASTVTTYGPYLITTANGAAYYVGYDTTFGDELWRTDGTVFGTYRVKDLNPAPGGGSGIILDSIRNVNGTIFFFGNDGSSNGNKLYKSNGTDAGTVLVKDVRPGADDWLYDGIGAAGNNFYFAFGDANGVELWVSDGTDLGTHLVKDINPGSGSSYPNAMIDLNGTLVFIAGGPGGQLWKSDGTEGGTSVLGNISPEGSSTIGQTNFVKVGNLIYMAASSPNTKQAIWKTDGTAAGTVLVAAMDPGGPGYVGTLAAGTSGCFFVADDGIRGTEMWYATPGTPPVVSVADFAHSPAPAQPPSVGFTMSEDVTLTNWALSAAGIALTNVKTNTAVAADKLARSYDEVGRRVTFTFPGFSGGVLPDGNYRAVLPAGSVVDASGDPLGLDYSFDFFVLAADANHDRVVDTLDFNALAANFGGTGKIFAQGDYNYDGVVDTLDFNQLAANFGKSVAPSGSAAVQSLPAPAAVNRMRFSQTPIDTRDTDDALAGLL